MPSTPHPSTPSPWHRRLRALVVVALFAIPVVGFLTFRADPGDAPPTIPARAAADQVVALEDRTSARPDDAQAWQELAVSYTSLAARDGDPAYYVQAERALERATELAPDAPGTLLARGNLELSLHRFADARRTGEQVVTAMPSSAAAHGVLVDAAVELGDYEAAADALQSMLDLDPGLPALARTSYLRELHGDLAGAVTAMQQAEAAGSALPDDRATVATLLGDLHRQRGDLAAAEAAYGRALETVPGSVPAELGLARVTAARNSPARAASAVAAIVDELPRLDAVVLLADLHAAAGDDDARRDAVELARAMAALQADAGQTVDLELALVEADHGDPGAAVALARSAYDARPDNIHTADALAWALHRAGRSEEARPFVDRSLRRGSADPLLRFHAAAILGAVGETAEARELLTGVLTSDPWFSFALLVDARALAAELGVAPLAAWHRP